MNGFISTMSQSNARTRRMLKRANTAPLRGQPQQQQQPNRPRQRRRTRHSDRAHHDTTTSSLSPPQPPLLHMLSKHTSKPSSRRHRSRRHRVKRKHKRKDKRERQRRRRKHRLPSSSSSQGSRHDHDDSTVMYTHPSSSSPTTSKTTTTTTHSRTSSDVLTPGSIKPRVPSDLVYTEGRGQRSSSSRSLRYHPRSNTVSTSTLDMQRVGSDGEFIPTLQSLQNTHARINVPWRYTRIGNVMHVRGCVELLMAAPATRLGPSTFTLTHLPCRHTPFKAYQHMEAALHGFIQQPHRAYNVNGVPHGGVAGIQCYVQVDQALLNSARPRIVMLSGSYDIDM